MLSFLVEVRPKDDCADWAAWQVYDNLSFHEVLNVCGVYVAHAFDFRIKRLRSYERIVALQRVKHEKGECR